MKKKDQTPTPIAVALRYDGKDAPRVTAKGEADIAEQIRRIAREHDVPLYENTAMARVLSQIDLGDEIPENLYRAVAEIIAFAYILSGRVCGVPEPASEPTDAVPQLRGPES